MKLNEDECDVQSKLGGFSCKSSNFPFTFRCDLLFLFFPFIQNSTSQNCDSVKVMLFFVLPFVFRIYIQCRTHMWLVYINFSKVIVSDNLPKKVNCFVYISVDKVMMMENQKEKKNTFELGLES